VAADITALHAAITKLYTGPAYAGGPASGIFGDGAPTGASIADVTYTPLDNLTASTVTALASSGSGASPLPAEVAFVTTFRSVVRGRRYRGRVYLPQKTNGTLTNGLLTPSVATQWVAQWTGFQAALAAISWLHVVASYKFSLYTAISSYSIDLVADVQTRRKR
jgi:hypothetical protein